MTLLVLFGGVSPEHTVSLRSAAYILDCAEKRGYTVLPVGIRPGGSWLYYPGNDWKAVSEDQWHRFPGCRPAVLSPARGQGLIVGAETWPVDAVFPVLHGCNGEDGSVQGLCQLAGVPCVGAGCAASAVCMDKAVTRVLAERRGIRQTEWISFFYDDYLAGPEPVAKRVGALDYPLFIKPARAGSSVGVSRVRAPDALPAALAAAAEVDRKIVAERSVSGREIEMAVVGNRAPIVSPCGEIVVSGAEFYDYGAKYINNDAQVVFPADLPPAWAEAAREMAREVYEAVDCEGLARVDCFIDEDGRPIFSEINTLPGCTPTSLFPKLMELAGLAGPDLVGYLVDLAGEAHRAHVERRIVVRG